MWATHIKWLYKNKTESKSGTEDDEIEDKENMDNNIEEKDNLNEVEDEIEEDTVVIYWFYKS